MHGTWFPLSVLRDRYFLIFNRGKQGKNNKKKTSWRSDIPRSLLVGARVFREPQNIFSGIFNLIWNYFRMFENTFNSQRIFFDPSKIFSDRLKFMARIQELLIALGVIFFRVSRIFFFEICSSWELSEVL